MGTTGWWTRWIGLPSRRAGRATLAAVLPLTVTLAAGDLLEASPAGRLGTLRLIDPFLDDGLQLVAWCVCRILRRAPASAERREDGESPAAVPHQQG